MLNYSEVVFLSPSLTKHANEFLNVQSLHPCLKLEWMLSELGCDTKIMEEKTQRAISQAVLYGSRQSYGKKPTS